MNRLLLHCGGELKSREEVFAVPLPEASPSYVPLPFETLVKRIEKQLRVEGMVIKDEKLALAKGGQRLFGLMQVEMPEMKIADYGCVLGFRNSYDKSCSAGLCIGATVFVCDNLSFHGSDVTFQRKHTANLLRDLSWIITETVASLPTRFTAQSKTFEVYRSTRLSDAEAHDLIIQMYDADTLNARDIPRILREWREPAHQAFAQSGKNLWRLFNAATEVLKDDLWQLPARTRALHNLFAESQRAVSEELVVEM